MTEGKFGSIKGMANKGLSKIDTAKLKEEIKSRIGEIDKMLTEQIGFYNEAYTAMNDAGMALYIERSNAANELGYIEELVNSIANKPKEFEAEFEEINVKRKAFNDVCSFAEREVTAARTAAGGAGAGLAAGASVVTMGPTAAMWVATTFGTASTGTAISTLSGAAATNAALAWLGGGTLAAGGGGMSAGSAFLAMAGPIGWSIAGATLLTSIVLFANKRSKINKDKNAEIEAVKENTQKVKKIEAQIAEILRSTSKARAGLFADYQKCFAMAGSNYAEFSDDQKQQLGALVNNARTLSALFGQTVVEGEE